MTKTRYTYKAEILKVVDGDTVDVKIDLGFSVYVIHRIRLNGIDTPEKNDKDAEVRALADVAHKRLLELCPVGSTVTLETFKADKYGRYLADIYTETHTDSVNQLLVEEQLAKPYNGGSR